MARLLFFGKFSDVAENGEVTLPEHVTDTEALIGWLGETHEGFAALWKTSGTMLVLNHQTISQPKPIKPSDEIAFLSALSGG